MKTLLFLSFFIFPFCSPHDQLFLLGDGEELQGQYLRVSLDEVVILAPKNVGTELYNGIYIYPRKNKVFMMSLRNNRYYEIIDLGTYEVIGQELNLFWQKRPHWNFHFEDLGNGLYKMQGANDYVEVWEKLGDDME